MEEFSLKDKIKRNMRVRKESNVRVKKVGVSDREKQIFSNN